MFGWVGEIVKKIDQWLSSEDGDVFLDGVVLLAGGENRPSLFVGPPFHSIEFHLGQYGSISAFFVKFSHRGPSHSLPIVLPHQSCDILVSSHRIFVY